MLSIIFLVTVPVATFFLGSRATITGFLWSRYPRWLGRLRDCAACSGFWDTLLLALFLRFGLGVPLPILPDSDWCPLLLALVGVVTTPLIAAAHARSLNDLGSAYAEVSEPERAVLDGPP